MSDKKPGPLSLPERPGGAKKRPATSRAANLPRAQRRPEAPALSRPEPAEPLPVAGKSERPATPRPRSLRPQGEARSPAAPAPRPGHRNAAVAPPRAIKTPRVERYFASCPRGLEPLLADELAMLQADAIEPGSGGVAFAGPPELAYRVNLHSRLATRVLQRVSAGRYFSEEEIYRGALAVFWERWFAVDRTLAVKVSAQACPLKSLEFVTLRIKDAICDRFREVTGRRPDVDTRSPDVRIHAHLDATHYTLFLDTSGEPLFKRGLRQQAGLAPINENLAAGILALAGWHPGIPLLDPMCGSGTFLLEAAQIALGIAPGLNRRFAFETFRHFDATAWRTLCDAARAVQRPASALPIYGSDLTAEALRDAHANLKAAGLAGAVTLSRADLRDLTPPAATGILVMNPPYGVRLGHEADLADFYPQLGDALKQRFSGWNAYIISADRALPKHIRLAASRRTPLYNGDLDCRLYEYRMVEGGNRG